MRVFLQIDPPAGFNPHTDSTLSLALEAQKRGYRLFYYTPGDLSSDRGEVVALAHPVTFYDRETHFFEAGAKQRMLLEDAADVILIRQDPPFNMSYLTTIWLLSGLEKPRIVNSARSLRDWPEKLMPLQFPQFCPPTLISANREELLAFQREVGTAVLKPLFGHGGHGVFHIDKAGGNLNALLEMFFAQSNEPVVLQQFLPEVAKEEKRILLVNGKIAGAFGRVPAQGEIRSNMRVGGKPVKTELTLREKEIAEAVGELCQHEGILLAGLDVIGDFLIEVNITSPTGLRTMQQLYGINPAEMFWDALKSMEKSVKNP